MCICACAAVIAVCSDMNARRAWIRAQIIAYTNKKKLGIIMAALAILMLVEQHPHSFRQSRSIYHAGAWPWPTCMRGVQACLLHT
eukprot:364484-Chlamydomonas_euryale.AAC.9